jgi:predicted RNA-binding Zn ribbon-like protein
MLSTLQYADGMAHDDPRAIGSTVAAANRAAALVDVLGRDEKPGRTLTRVVAVLREYGELDPIVATEADLPGLRAVAARLREVFAAPDLAAAADRLNTMFAEFAGPPRLTSHEGSTNWHLHTDADDDSPLDEWLATSSALALATLLTERQAPPGGICAAPDCSIPFVDRGQGAPRRFCSPRCASRVRVAAHRRRRRDA